jgi:hypothetical protein
MVNAVAQQSTRQSQQNIGIIFGCLSRESLMSYGFSPNQSMKITAHLAGRLLI